MSSAAGRIPGKQRWSLAGPSCTLNLGYRAPNSEYLGRNLNREKLKGLGCSVSGLGMQTPGKFRDARLLGLLGPRDPVQLDNPVNSFLGTTLYPKT